VKVEWSPRATTTASRFLDDINGMRAVVSALDDLAGNPYPAGSFRWETCSGFVSAGTGSCT
jgi:hypothetical protein